ncbi:MAG: hypothetical protein ACUVSK_08820 [Desulfotomaculales bacterium]
MKRVEEAMFAVLATGTFLWPQRSGEVAAQAGHAQVVVAVPPARVVLAAERKSKKPREADGQQVSSSSSPFQSCGRSFSLSYVSSKAGASFKKAFKTSGSKWAGSTRPSPSAMMRQAGFNRKKRSG